MTPTPRPRVVLRGVVGVMTAAVVVGASDQASPRSGFDVSAFDRSARPQDDLYRHVNGRWLDTVEIAADRVTETAATQLFDQMERDVRAIIERLADRPGPRAGSSAQQVIDLYASVINEAAIEARGASPLAPELQAIDRMDSARALAERAGVLSATTTAGPFFVSLQTHPLNPADRVVRLSQGGLLLEREYYLGNDARSQEVRSRYQRYLEQIFTLVGRPGAAADARAVLALEITLAQAHVAPGTAATTSDGKVVSLAALFADMPGFDWVAWGRPQGMNRSTAILVQQPSFFRVFTAMVPAVPFSTWRAWLAGRYITAMSPHVSKAIGLARFEFFGRFLRGQPAPRPNWKRGVSLVNAALGDAVGRLYIAEHFPRTSRARVERIAAQVIRSSREVVSGFDWPAENMKLEAQSRIARLTARVGHPDIWRDYRGLTIDRDDLFGNIMRIYKFDGARRMAQLMRPVPGGEWPLAVQTVNAFYNPPTNEIFLPAALLRPPYFDAEADDAVNYGAIGAVIGHEIGHALEVSGRRIPAGMTNEAFNDLTGLTVAARAYQRSRGGREAPVLDGLTGDQRFFLSWARLWRERIRPEYAPQLALTSPYPPGTARANSAVRHLDAFHVAFGVVPGDRLFLQPANRIRVF